VPGYTDITSGYHHADRPNHWAIDIGAPKGAAVVAPADGMIVFAKKAENGGYGYSVRIVSTDPDLCGPDISACTFLTAHLSQITVKEGQAVKAGDKIGEVGNTGESQGPHLHLELINHPLGMGEKTIQNGRDRLNPERLLGDERKADMNQGRA
jgi:murein DD-endopeptidase MepM/ murein hydrolase activator NlpD